MIRRRSILAVALASSLAAVSLAATRATLILTNGDRHSGTLVYRRDANFNLIENGRERSWPQRDVAVIEIAGDTPPASELNKLPRSDYSVELERNMVALRNGSVVIGKLYNINENDSITIDTREGQRRDIAFSDIARIYMSPPAARSIFRDVMNPPSAPAPAPKPSPAPPPPTPDVPGAIRVEANRPWNDTGITVRKGDRVAFRSSGIIKFGQADNQTANPDGSAAPDAPRGPRFPVPEVPVGALIFRVSNSAPSPIGTNSQPITMPADGRLYLAVNDDNYGDNSGAFAVVVTPQRRR